ncbi:dUTP diphosphatase [Blattabacterium cuenoti]|uniref:dUTP diphosphatase n=1 Tax=Blattabacterium cuenoti TaxID=1653831 RepID=UPI00163D0919|nr:dUTP diphosphatase [Blattabacterium cuenoti]
MILKANIEQSIFINFLERKLIPTDLFFKFPKKGKYFFLLKKEFIQAISTVHIIKKNERFDENQNTLNNNIQIIIINPFYKTIIINPNDSLAKIDLFKIIDEIKWKECSTINSSIRGVDSFGSTGIL